MIETVLGLYRRRGASQTGEAGGADIAAELRRRKIIVFFVITFGYGFYYICRLSFSVAKKPLVDAGVFDAAELGVIGSALFFAYAAGKLVNGVLADRINIRIFMSIGLFISAAINLCLGFTTAFWVFLVLWGLNGWAQSIGAPASVVAIARWYGNKERGSVYGLWSSSHNIGEAITFICTAVVISSLGWMWGLRAAGVLCLLMSVVIWKFLYERPEAHGLPSVVRTHGASGARESVGAHQWAVLRNPAVWILALSSAFFYVTRYAVNSWGIFFLEAEKGYSTVEASSIVSANAIAGIVGTVLSGILSDRFFDGRRNLPALIFGILYSIAITVFVFGPRNVYVDTASMVLFGLALGVLLVYLGGLMAVDICSKQAAGTALGVVGVASYVGAGLQDVISGWLIEGGRQVVDGRVVYDFDAAGLLWIGSAVASLLLATLVWNVRPAD